VIFCAETERAANQVVADLAEAYQGAGVTARPSPSFCRWGPESLNYHAGRRATNAASERYHGKMEASSAGLRVPVESQRRHWRAARLLRPPACAVDRILTGMIMGDQFKLVDSTEFREEPISMEP